MLLVFYNSKNLNCIGALSCRIVVQLKYYSILRCSWFFYNSKILNCIGALYWSRLEEEYWRSPFLISFIRVIFAAGNETTEKIWSDFGVEQK